jgi:hypothetical protein
MSPKKDLLRAVIVKKMEIDNRYDETVLKHLAMNCKKIISICRKRL